MVQTQTFTTSDGAKIGYQIHGSAPGVPLVLINGLSAVLEDWSPLVEHLAKKRKGECHSKQPILLPHS